VAAFTVPDVLVLAGGGVLGEAWMTGMLAGIEDATGADLRRAEAFVGTSAGAIVAARLAAGERPRRPPAPPPGAAVAAADPGRAARPGRARERARAAAAWGWAVTSPLAAAAVAAGGPGAALARAALLARAPTGGRRLDRLHASIERSGARFDGRLRICCVDKRSGRRVVFGAPGAPAASVADAVVASCAIPWVFAPVTIRGREYVDGGAWSVTNLDAAPAGRGTEVLCLDVVAGLRARSGRARALRRAFRAAAVLEAQVLRRRGARVRHVVPDAGSAAAIGDDLMDPGPGAEALAAGYAQGRALGGR
jgi:NTE family protein